MIKRILLALVVVAATLLTVTPAADAGTRGCVTRHEFYSVHKGMRMARVHRVWGTTGQLTKRMGDGQDRGYRICSTYELNVFAEFVLKHGVWRLYEKWANAQ